MRFFVVTLMGLLLAKPLLAQEATRLTPEQVNGNTIRIPILRAVFGHSDTQETKQSGFGDNKGPSRKVGGEKIALSFKTDKRISRIQLTAFSNSRKGRVLIHKVDARDTAGVSSELAKFSGVMLAHKEYVRDLLSTSVKSLLFQVESYSHDDATLLLEISSEDGFTANEFSIQRESVQEGGRYGEFFDESDYPRFKPSDFKNLFANSSLPTADALVRNSWVCSSYTTYPDWSVSPDFKTRKYYFDRDGLLKSITDLSAEPASWVATEEGMKTRATPTVLCNQETNSHFVSRLTPQGNLVSELVVTKEDLCNSCSASSRQNVDRDLKKYRMIPSYISEKYVRVFFEFCRPIQL